MKSRLHAAVSLLLGGVCGTAQRVLLCAVSRRGSGPSATSMGLRHERASLILHPGLPAQLCSRWSLHIADTAGAPFLRAWKDHVARLFRKRAALSAGEPLAPRVDPPPPKRRKRGGDGDNALGRKRARSARPAPPVNNKRARVERIQRHWALAAATAASAGTSPASSLTGTALIDTYVRAGRATSGALT